MLGAFGRLRRTAQLGANFEPVALQNNFFIDKTATNLLKGCPTWQGLHRASRWGFGFVCDVLAGLCFIG